MTAEESPSTGSGVLGWGSRYVLSSSDFEALQEPWEGVAVTVLHGLRAVPIGARRLAVGCAGGNPWLSFLRMQMRP